ncbi:MAG: nucleotidyl transferase AbiEii/AbiGii toxin family protein [Bacteroidetes bacterium]|nr:nucleotidyl transferase AbiEii/AbiGii toxin family protein [Bacteroidota bacterium]
MLQISAIEPRTFSVLKRLMKLHELKNFSLVGGTALALKFGHRRSVDLDLFCDKKINQQKITAGLQKEFGSDFFYEPSKIAFAVFCKIQNIKVDIVHYPHPVVKIPQTIKGIRFYSIQDIAAMKINAILGRGSKKDFYDIAEILKHYSMQQIIDWHTKKYPAQMLLISIPAALVYFDDAEKSQEPIILNNQTWERVKKFIQLKVREYLT